MKKRPQIQSDWALYNCISQKGSTVPNSQELGSLLETPLLYTLTIFSLLSVLQCSHSGKVQAKTQVLNIPWKLGDCHRPQSWNNPNKNLVFCFTHRNAKSFPRPCPLLWKIILNFEFYIHNHAATGQENPVYNHSRRVCSKHDQDKTL